MDIPNEILVQIIFELPCKYIISISCVSKYFTDLCGKENIIEKRKIKGFPRSTGYCESHVSYYYPDDKIIPSDSVLDNIVKMNNDLIRGDLIYFADNTTHSDLGIGIFDDCNIILLNDRNIPGDFTIINDDIPIRYWKDLGNEALFDHVSVKKQCIEYISYIGYDEGYINGVYAIFKMNNKSYKIIYEESSRSECSIIYKKFKDRLLDDTKLRVYYERKSDKNIIFMSL